MLPLAEILSITEEAFVLLEHYETHGVLEARFRNDMLQRTCIGAPRKEEERKNKLGFRFSRIEKLYQGHPHARAGPGVQAIVEERKR
jgi:hypothetical protein